MKKALCILVVIVLASTCLIAYAAETNQWTALRATFNVFVKGEEFQSQDPIVAINGRTYLPLKAIGDVLGVDVVWNEQQRRVEVAMTENDKEKDVAPVIINHEAGTGEYILDVALESVKAKPGDTVEIPLKFENIPAQGIDSLNLSLYYDSKAVEVLKVEPGSIVTNPDVNFAYNVATKNSEIIMLFVDESQKGEESIKTDGEFAKLVIKIKSDVFNKSEASKMFSLITFGESNFCDYDLNTILATFKEAKVEIEK
ncbi:MAG TPA: cohesin domain-containing protein [Acetivibrio sp.]|uniref:cohesin domain-containing protein n=1 Tax=Acetivibrio sp. TaxID=1872092 RepID=UPI002C42BB67|nr:cohesin domain-containing protein [Acetivibrio sp.]HOM02866.1 cohesin domain-containing protein [Acetivibrio sp.]